MQKLLVLQYFELLCCNILQYVSQLQSEALLNLNGEENQICLFGVCLLMT